MTGAEIGTLVGAVVALLGALTAYLQSRTAKKSAAQANARLDAHEQPGTHGQHEKPQA